MDKSINGKINDFKTNLFLAIRDRIANGYPDCENITTSLKILAINHKTTFSVLNKILHKEIDKISLCKLLELASSFKIDVTITLSIKDFKVNVYDDPEKNIYKKLILELRRYFRSRTNEERLLSNITNLKTDEIKEIKYDRMYKTFKIVTLLTVLYKLEYDIEYKIEKT